MEPIYTQLKLHEAIREFARRKTITKADLKEALNTLRVQGSDLTCGQYNFITDYMRVNRIPNTDDGVYKILVELSKD